MRYLITLLILFMGVNVSNAQISKWITVDGGLKVIEGESGYGFNGKASFVVRNFLIEANPIDLSFIPQEPSGDYRKETTSDGRSICRDTRNGQFASSENCAPTYDTYYAFSANVNYMLAGDGLLIYVGPGFRIGTPTTPYGNFGFVFGETPFSQGYHWFVKGSGGKDFFELSLGMSFNL